MARRRSRPRPRLSLPPLPRQPPQGPPLACATASTRASGLATALPPWSPTSPRNRANYRGEVEIEREGIRRVIGYSLRGLLDPEAEAGMLILFQDLTDLKELEREARFNQQLAAVGELAAGIAHEIRNPLASISGS